MRSSTLLASDLRSSLRFSWLVFDKFDALDHSRRLATSRCFGGIDSECDPSNTWRLSLLKIAFEGAIEVEFGNDGFVWVGFAETDEASAGVKVSTLIRKIGE